MNHLHTQAKAGSKPFSALAFLQSSSLPMLIQEEIERLIMSGELSGGARINESELALRFNTSRGPIREALRALESNGLVRNEKNRGVFVREIAFEEADEIYEVRAALEEIIGRRVASNIKPAAIKRLRAMHDAMQSAALAQNLAHYNQLNWQFHDILLEAAGSKTLLASYHRLVKQLHLFRLRALASGGGLEISVNEHQNIIDAIASGDPQAAGQALRQHVQASRERMRQAFGRSPATPQPQPEI